MLKYFQYNNGNDRIKDRYQGCYKCEAFTSVISITNRVHFAGSCGIKDIVIICYNIDLHRPSNDGVFIFWIDEDDSSISSLQNFFSENFCQSCVDFERCLWNVNKVNPEATRQSRKMILSKDEKCIVFSAFSLSTLWDENIWSGDFCWLMKGNFAKYNNTSETTLKCISLFPQLSGRLVVTKYFLDKFEVKSALGSHNIRASSSIWSSEREENWYHPRDLYILIT